MYGNSASWRRVVMVRRSGVGAHPVQLSESVRYGNSASWRRAIMVRCSGVGAHPVQYSESVHAQ
eukprot:5806598-Pyramimonas_sp.AAC.1